jgi:hypothetical protein
MHRHAMANSTPRDAPWEQLNCEHDDGDDGPRRLSPL